MTCECNSICCNLQYAHSIHFSFHQLIHNVHFLMLCFYKFYLCRYSCSSRQLYIEGYNALPYMQGARLPAKSLEFDFYRELTIATNINFVNFLLSDCFCNINILLSCRSWVIRIWRTVILSRHLSLLKWCSKTAGGRWIIGLNLILESQLSGCVELREHIWNVFWCKW